MSVTVFRRPPRRRTPPTRTAPAPSGWSPTVSRDWRAAAGRVGRPGPVRGRRHPQPGGAVRGGGRRRGAAPGGVQAGRGRVPQRARARRHRRHPAASRPVHAAAGRLRPAAGHDPDRPGRRGDPHLPRPPGPALPAQDHRAGLPAIGTRPRPPRASSTTDTEACRTRTVTVTRRTPHLAPPSRNPTPPPNRPGREEDPTRAGPGTSGGRGEQWPAFPVRAATRPAARGGQPVPVHVLKIDKAFVDEVASGSRSSGESVMPWVKAPASIRVRTVATQSGTPNVSPHVSRLVCCEYDRH